MRDLIFRDVKGSRLTPQEGDANLRELEFRAGRQPLVISSSTQLSVELHANRELLVNSPTAVELRLPALPEVGVKFFGLNLGAGAVRMRKSDGSEVPGSAILPDASAQWEPFEVRAWSGGFVRVA